MKRIVLLFLLVSQYACVGGVAAPLTPHEERTAEQLIEQGAAFLRVGRLDEARASFLLSAELSVTPAALDGLGCVDFLLGELTSARDLFLRAHQLDENYVESLSNLALLYNFIGAQREAEKLYERVLQVQPTALLPRNNLGVLLEEQGNRDRARDELYKGYVLSHSDIARENLKRVGEEAWQP
jgi:Flp pilus assembly protein TadD